MFDKTVSYFFTIMGVKIEFTIISSQNIKSLILYWLKVKIVFNEIHCYFLFNGNHKYDANTTLNHINYKY